MVVTGYQVGRMYNHLGNKPLGMTVREFPDEILWGELLPLCRHHGPLGLDSSLRENENDS